MSTLTPSQRVKKALKGATVDRPPLLFWHHFQPQGSGLRMAELTDEFFVNKFRLDIVKVMPDLPYPVEKNSIADARELHGLSYLGLDTPIFQEQLRCIRQLRARLGEEYPILVTHFSPLTYVLRFIGKKKAIEAARQNPGYFLEGVKIVTANLQTLFAAEIDTGADGIFFACMGAVESEFTPDEYAFFGRPSDLEALDAAKKGWLNILHIHADPNQKGQNIYFDTFTDYPVSAISWSDTLGGPSLKEALTMTDKCVMGGLGERGPLTHGDEKAIKDEIDAAIKQTNGTRIILANGCSLPEDSPEKWLMAAREYMDTIKF